MKIFSLTLMVIAFATSAFAKYPTTIGHTTGLQGSDFHAPIQNSATNPDSLHRFYSTDSISFNHNERTIYTYNSNGDILTLVTLSKNVSMTWDTIYAVTQTFDANNNVLTVLAFNGTSYSLTTYTYNANNKIETILDQLDNNGIWENSAISYFEYDNNGNDIKDSVLYWNSTSWDPGTISLRTYNSNNKITQNVTYYYDMGSFIPMNRFIYNYDVNSLLTSLVFYQYLNVWMPQSRNLYTYDSNNNLTRYLFQSWNGSNYDDSYKNEYEYDVLNNLTQASSSFYNAPTWSLNAIQRNIYSGATLTHSVYAQYSPPGVFSNIDSTVYFYPTVSILDIQNQNLSIFPNPTNGNCIITHTGAMDAVEVFNINGQLVASKNVNGLTTNIDLNNLPSGTYSVRVWSAGKPMLKRIVKN